MPHSRTPSPFCPKVEPLEDRVTPVINPYAPNPVPAGFVTVDGVALDGVVQLDISTPGGTGIGSGSLLRSQRHILTAAHNVTDTTGQIDVTSVTVTFRLNGWANNPITYTVLPTAIWKHPSWNGNFSDGNDIAVLTLPSLAPSGPNGLGATGYLPYTGFDEVGKQFEFAGYGRTGTGNTGGIAGTSGTGKRLGYNRFDTRTNPVPGMSDTGLAFDFDDGSVANNTLVAYGSPKTPVKTGDSMIGKGDSGGPSFLNGLIAGITSGTYAYNDGNPDGDFGDMGVVERVSLHAGQINGFLTEGHALTIRMDQQRPADGVRDRLMLLREGTDVVFYVNDQFYHRVPLSRVSSITVVGGRDSEDFYVDSDLRKVVNFQGGGGTNRVFVRNAAGAATYDVSVAGVSVVSGTPALTLSYDGVRAVEVAGDAADRVRVNSVRLGTPLTVVDAGTVDVGVRGTGTLGPIADSVTVNGNTSLFVNDDAWTTPRTYALSPNQFVADYLAPAWTTINFNGLSVMELNGGSGGNATTVTGTPATNTRLYTGTGVDTTRVRSSTTGVIAIDGQAGNDTVNLGFNGSVQSLLGTVRIDNGAGFTTVNADNSNDAAAKTVTMQATANGYVSVTGLTQGNVRVARDAVRRLNLWTGAGNDTFTIQDTPDSFPPLSFGTTIRSGNGNDVFNVNGTSGTLAIETGGGTDNLVRVGNNANALNRINGEMSVDGAG